MNMGATLFRLTVDECIAGFTREAARAGAATASAASPWAWTATWRSGTSMPPPTWSIALDSTRCTRAWCADSPTCLPLGATHEQHPGSSPGHVTLAQWRQVYRGAPLALDPAALPVVRASAAAVAPSSPKAHRCMASTPASASWPACASSARPGHPAAQYRALARCWRGRTDAGQRGAVDDGAEAGQPGARRIGHSRNPAAARSDADQGRIARGAGTRLGGCFRRSGTAFAPGRRDAGRGRSYIGDERLPATDALARAGLQPIDLGAKEGLALLNGTQFSTAYALAGLFEIETVFQAALVTGALSVEAASSDTPFDPRIHAIRGQRGQIATAATLRTLMQGSGIRESHRDNDVRVQDPTACAASRR